MIASQITTPTVVTSEAGRIGVAVYDNPLVTDNTHKSVVVIYADQTWKQEARSKLTAVPGGAGVPQAFSFIQGIGQGNV